MPNGFFTYTRNLQRKEFNFESHATEKFCAIGTSLYRHSVGNVYCGRRNKHYLFYWFVSRATEHPTIHIAYSFKQLLPIKIDTIMIRITITSCENLYCEFISDISEQFPWCHVIKCVLERHYFINNGGWSINSKWPKSLPFFKWYTWDNN